ncbi:MAG: hypothetical protein ABIO06_05590 [Pseudolysinimonas sp.]
MQLNFEVGAAERHTIGFSFDKVMGGTTVEVDGVRLKDEVTMTSKGQLRSYSFTVGTQEQHAVRIDKQTPGLFGAYRPQSLRAYVDGVLVAEGAA